jgi:hypothetical protein
MIFWCWEEHVYAMDHKAPASPNYLLLPHLLLLLVLLLRCQSLVAPVGPSTAPVAAPVFLHE